MKIQREYKIYKITNLINNKIYIGRTYLTLEQRFWKHKDNAIKRNKTFYLYKSMRKHGIENFKIELIENNKTLTENKDRETFYILKFKSYIPTIGYNILIGNNNETSYFQPKMQQQIAKSIQKLPPTRSKIGYKGISIHKYKKSIVFGVKIYNGRGNCISQYCSTIEEAINFYDRLALHIYGDEAFINKEEKRTEYLQLNKSEGIDKLLNKINNKHGYKGCLKTNRNPLGKNFLLEPKSEENKNFLVIFRQRKKRL